MTMAYEDNPHKMGRPTRAEAPAASVTIRLTDDEREHVSAHVERTGWTRAALIREAMYRMGLFDPRAKLKLEG